jgi:uncharacterized protein
MLEQLIGRDKEKDLLLQSYKSDRSELIAVIGRRRVGKTFLVRHVFENLLDFEMTGMQHGGMENQLINFAKKISEFDQLAYIIQKPRNWLEAFDLLRVYLSKKKSPVKKVLFFDELPWISTLRSGFLEAFGHFWNDWAVYNPVAPQLAG